MVLGTATGRTARPGSPADPDRRCPAAAAAMVGDTCPRRSLCRSWRPVARRCRRPGTCRSITQSGGRERLTGQIFAVAFDLRETFRYGPSRRVEPDAGGHAGTADPAWHSLTMATPCSPRRPGRSDPAGLKIVCRCRPSTGRRIVAPASPSPGVPSAPADVVVLDDRPHRLLRRSGVEPHDLLRQQSHRFFHGPGQLSM